MENQNRKVDTSYQVPFDLKCIKLEDELVNLLNQSGLPITTVYYILKDVFSQIERIKEETRLTQEREYLEQTGEFNEEVTVNGQAEIIHDDSE